MTGVIISCATSESSSSFTLSRHAIGIVRGVYAAKGFASVFRCIVMGSQFMGVNDSPFSMSLGLFKISGNSLIKNSFAWLGERCSGGLLFVVAGRELRDLEMPGGGRGGCDGEERGSGDGGDDGIFVVGSGEGSATTFDMQQLLSGTWGSG